MLGAVMNDPLLEGGIGFDEVLIVLLKVLVGFGGLLVAVIAGSVRRLVVAGR